MSQVESTTSVTESLRTHIVRYNIIAVELGVLVSVWYWFIGKWWHDTIIPGGLEYSRSMHSFYFWESWQKCGECAYWGNINGGNPALQDLYGSFLHPFSMLTTLTYGAMAGSALTVELAFLLMACVSWWFAHNLQVHPIARVWFALASMMGGHMVSRLELGNVGLVLSLASAWCAIVTIIWFIDRPSFVRAVVVAVALASAMLAGQGYMQLLLLSVMPILGYYAWRQQVFELPRWTLVRFALVISGLVVLTTAPLWLNMLQPNQLYIKETAGDDYYYQPITRLVVNLMLDEYDIAKSDLYNNYAYPWVYTTFIGLSSVFFALTGVYWVRQPRYRLLYLIFAGVASWSVLIASGLPRTIVQYIPVESFQVMIDGMRYLVVANGYFALAILVMAMFSIHAILTETHWWPATLQRIFARVPAQATLSIVIMVILIVNLYQLYQYNKSWIDDVNGYDENQQTIVDLLKTEPHAVVNAPDWMIIPLLHNNIKMTNVTIPWQTPIYQLPEPQYMLSMEPPAESERIKELDKNWTLYKNTRVQSHYALVFHPDGTMTPCESTATSGDIEVRCTLDQPGELRVAEFYVTGWHAVVNGADTPINITTESNVDNINVVRVSLNEGESRIELRFRPWQATVSMYGYFAGWITSFLLIITTFVTHKPTNAV